MVQMVAILKNDSHFEFQNSTDELFYANYLKLPKADSEPTKIFCKLGILANKMHWKKT